MKRVFRQISAMVAIFGLLSSVSGTIVAAAPLAGLSQWSKLDLNGVQVNALALDPSLPNLIYAGSNGGGVFQTTNGGQSWAAINSGLGNLVVNALSVDPTTPLIVLAATGRGPLVGEPGAGVYRTTNRGGTWAVTLNNADTLALARAPQNTQIVYAGAGALFKSADGGVTWIRLSPSGNPLLNTDIFGVTVSPLDPNVLVAVGNTEGGTGRIFRSSDGGVTWTLVLDGQPPLFDAQFSPPSPSGATVLVAGQAGVYRSTNGGVSFQQITTGLGSAQVRRVLFNPLMPSQAFAATNGGVFQSNDAGVTWTALGAGSLGNQSARSLAMSVSDPQTLFAGTDDGVWTFTFATAPPPPPVTTYYFAEGSTQPPFDTWFLIQNPTNQTATVRFTFEIQGGGVITRDFGVGPTSRFSLFANQLIPNVAFSTRVDASQAIFAERAMYVSYDGDVITGIPAPNRTWLFAEGSTQPPFHTWLLLQNPNSQPATATITYLLVQGTPVTQVVGLAPNSRTSIFVNQVLPNQAFSSRVDSDLPIVAERAMYRFPGNAATVNPGVNAPAATWYFPDGNTTQGSVPFDTFLLLENPNPTPTTATVTLYRSNGSVQSFLQPLAPRSRLNVFLNQVLPNARFGIQVTANQPIVAERSEFFGAEPRGAISTQGATALATTWNLPEGSTQDPFTEFIEILNPQSATMGVHIDFDLPNGQVIGRDFQIAPNRPLSLNVNQLVPNSPVSARITTSLPSVVERTMFISKLGSLGGHDTIGIPG